MIAPPRPESLVSFATILHGVQKARLSHPPALRNRFSPGPPTDCFTIDYPVTCAVPNSPAQPRRTSPPAQPTDCFAIVSPERAFPQAPPRLFQHHVMPASRGVRPRRATT